MRAVQAIREERTDVFEIWDFVKTIINDEIVSTDKKLEDVTVVEIEKRLTYLAVQKQDIEDKMVQEQEKIDLINAL